MFGVMLCRRLRISEDILGVYASRSRTLARFLSSEKEKLHKAHSFTVSYLINSCGLSREAAIVASKKVRLRDSETPDSVLAFLRDHELSDAQISNFVMKTPAFLLSNPSKTFLPKLEFFYSKGVSKETMAKYLSKDASLLKRSLTNFIVPTFDLLKNIPATEEQVLGIMRLWLPLKDYADNVVSNIRLLKGLGIKDSRFGSALMNFPNVMIASPERFAEVVNKVSDMGFDPDKAVFLYAVRTFSSEAYEKRWRENFKVYEKWGWSESDILMAFKYFPSCMAISEEKIDKVMDYLVNVMGQPTKEIARYPVILCYSLEKRIQPRCSVARVLCKKGLVKQDDFNLASLVTLYTGKTFLAKFVTKYKKEVPLLMSVYRGKVNIDDA